MRLVLELFWLARAVQPLTDLSILCLNVTVDLNVLSFAFLFWQRLEGLSLATSVSLVIPVLSSMYSHVVSFVELLIFPKYSLVLNDLDVQNLRVM